MNEKHGRFIDEYLIDREAVVGADCEVKMRDPRAATAAIAELNKMDGEYKQTPEEFPQVVFIQDFGSASED